MNALRSIVSIAIGLVVGAAAFSLSPALADTDPLPACETIDSLDCTVTVSNVRAGENFCQQLEGQATTTTCEAYWPFRNPTVNAHAANAEAFPSDYEQLRVAAYRLGVQVDNLSERVDHRDAKIKQLRKKIERLRHRLH